MDDHTLFALDEVTLRRGVTVVLDGVSAEMPRGACTGVVGRSGSGKSALLRLLTRLDDPDSGAISFGGSALTAYDILGLRRRVQLVAQQPTLVTDRVLDEVRLGAPALSDQRVGTLLTRVGLPPSFAGRATAGLSGGEAQRLALARALALNPEVVLLDEPTSALDAETTSAIEETVRGLVDAGNSVVLVSHNIAQIDRVAAHTIVLDHGRVITSGPPDVSRRSEVPQ